MDTGSRLIASSATSGGVGSLLTAAFFNPEEPWFFVGMLLILIGCAGVTCGTVIKRARTMDEEFHAGYSVGYREGRRVPPLEVVAPIKRAADGLSMFNRQVRHGRLPKAPIGPMASHGATPGRAQAHQDGPA